MAHGLFLTISRAITRTMQWWSVLRTQAEATGHGSNIEWKPFNPFGANFFPLRESSAPELIAWARFPFEAEPAWLENVQPFWVDNQDVREHRREQGEKGGL